MEVAILLLDGTKWNIWGDFLVFWQSSNTVQTFSLRVCLPLKISQHDHNRFSKDERELLFKLRSKTIWVKDNFRNAYLDNDMLCDLCKLFPCTQAHPLQCPQLMTTMIVDKKLNINDNFIYGDVDQQLVYVKIYSTYWELGSSCYQNRVKTNNQRVTRQ